VPPFIEAVTPKSDLPIPETLHTYSWIVLVAYESTVLRKGVELLGTLDVTETVFITVSHVPQEARDLLDGAGIDLDRTVSLPLQNDANVFGLMNASCVTVVSNGFLQIMEALAMGSPVIALARGSGVGMNSLNIDDRFLPFVSFGESLEQQRERVMHWMARTPFSPSLRKALQSERGGVSRCADMIEALVHQRAETPKGWPLKILKLEQ
jgi:hypothetical protein